MIEIKGLETYFGGKGASGAYQKIINHIPECDIMVSGFLGACFITRSMNNLPARFIGIDRDPEVIRLWKESFSNITSDVTLYNDTFQNIYYNKLYRDLSKYQKPFIYLDPPYLFSTRKSKHKYKYEMGDEYGHYNLLFWMRNCKYNVAISTYDNDLYDTMLTNWKKIHFQVNTRKGVATETLYMNYDISKLALQDYSYSGSNYRERDRIRQKTKRWKKRIEKMSKEERDYVFLELQKHYSQIQPHQI
jgi:DNA adenine methylase